MKERFFRCFAISLIVIGCISFGFLGIIKAYENTRRVGFGDYKSAIEIGDNKIRILDLYLLK